jgi:hypothetical protein
MKTTVEIPDPTLWAARIRAAELGITLKELFSRALVRELEAGTGLQPENNAEPPWMKEIGKFGTTPALRRETRRIQKRIDEEFGQIDPEDWR